MAGTTTALQWNPTQANQESNAAYLADGQRAGGATNPSIFDAVLANKLFNQLSNYIFALFTMYANKGFTTDDSNISTLITQCANFLTTADVKTGLEYVPYSPVLAFDALHYAGFQVTLTGNLSFTITGASIGDLVTFSFTQDGVGGHTVAYPPNVVGGGAPSTTPNSNSVQMFRVLNDNFYHAAGPVVVS